MFRGKERIEAGAAYVVESAVVYRMGMIVAAIEVDAVKIVEVESKLYTDMYRSHQRRSEGEARKCQVNPVGGQREAELRARFG